VRHEPTHTVEHLPMEQGTLKNINNCLNNNIYSYVETSGACVIKLITAVSITAVFFFVRCYKNLKKNSRVIYPNMTVNYPDILTLEKEGFFNFFDGQIGHG
jgi:hypothetical protein